MYNQLVAEGRLSQDDGALEKEFGKAPLEKTTKILKKKGKE